MIAKITAFLKQLQQDDIEQKDPLSIELASAVLYCEVMLADGDTEESEINQIKQLLESKFKLDHESIDELLDVALNDVEHATDLYQYTKLINQHFSVDEKVIMVEHLWHIAYADGHLSEHEAHIIRKLADLLHLRHHEYIQGKINAQDALNKL